MPQEYAIMHTATRIVFGATVDSNLQMRNGVELVAVAFHIDLAVVGDVRFWALTDNNRGLRPATDAEIDASGIDEVRERNKLQVRVDRVIAAWRACADDPLVHPKVREVAAAQHAWMTEGR